MGSTVNLALYLRCREGYQGIRCDQFLPKTDTILSDPTCLSVDIPVPPLQISHLTAPSPPYLSLANLLRAIFSSTHILSKRQTSSLLPSPQFSVQLIS
ncbi:Pro-neuregulin-3, membrane-bound isoform [Collichthys lucidus]|uniref:Pro-neuregulin-3, membrane-bound isoform n=1 Tax=Collichthys lucidus TaxID=240159 RepID=A0A4U5VE91_COLLU|nr:Pro-neuregulin-3, membrane-bound isoform [Collichthys lucidus]